MFHFYTSFVTRPAHFIIHGGTGHQTSEVPVGVSHVSMPFQLGRPRFRLLRNGRTLIEKQGEQEIADRQGETRYNYFAGQADSSETEAP